MLKNEHSNTTTNSKSSRNHKNQNKFQTITNSNNKTNTNKTINNPNNKIKVIKIHPSSPTLKSISKDNLISDIIKNQQEKNIPPYETYNFNKNNLTSQYTYSSDPTIDEDLIKLYKEYAFARNSCQQTQNIFNTLNNKLNLLKKEENEIKDKKTNYLTKLKKNKKIQSDNKSIKELLLENKIKNEENLKNQKLKNENLKYEIENTLKTFRFNVINNNKKIGNEIKEKKIKLFKSLMLNREQDLNNKQIKAIKVQRQRAISQENKKQKEYEKKLKIKNDLLKKIKIEENKKKSFDKSVEFCHRESMKVIKRIKDINNNNGINNKENKIIFSFSKDDINK